MKSKKSQKNPYEISRNTKNAVKKHQPGKKTRIYPDHTPKSDRFLFFLKIIYIAPVSKIDVPVNF